MRAKPFILAGSLLFLAGIAAADQDLVLDPPPQKDLVLDPQPGQERELTVDEQNELLFQDMMKTGPADAQPKGALEPDHIKNAAKQEPKPKIHAQSKSGPKPNPVPPLEEPAPGGPAPGYGGPGYVPASGPSAPGPAASGGAAPNGAPSGGAASMTSSGKSAAKTAPARKNAERMADQLKKSLGAGPEGMMGGGPRPAAGPKPGEPNPANPQTADDLALASMSGFSGSFGALGLKAGKGPSGEAAILNEGGGAATPEQLAKLRERIAGEPTALMRRPDFYTVLPREKFQALKDSYRSKPELRETAFKHIEMSAAERDFQRSASCEPLSGGCNPATAQKAYRKGELVPPEDLSKIQKDLEPDAESWELDGGEQSAASPKASFEASSFDKIYAKLNGLIGSIKDTMGTGGEDGKPSEPSAVAAGSAEAGWAGSSSGEAKPVSFSEQRKPLAAGAVPLPAGVHPPAPGSPAAAARRARAKRTIGFALPGAALLLFAIWRFRRKKSFLEQSRS